MESKTKEGHFERVGGCPGCRLTDQGQLQKQPRPSVDLATPSFGLGPATSIYLSKDTGRVSPTLASGNRHRPELELGASCGP